MSFVASSNKTDLILNKNKRKNFCELEIS